MEIFKIPIKEHIQSCQARRKRLQLLDIEENDDLTLPEHTPEELDEVDHEYLKVSTKRFFVKFLERIQGEYKTTKTVLNRLN